jgi:hypothetical protein
MKKYALPLLILVSAFQFKFAQADTVIVPLPNSDIYGGEPNSQSVDVPGVLDISLASWTPPNLNPYSSLANVSNFSPNFPGASISFLGPIKYTRTGEYYFRIGGEYRSESRSAVGYPSESLNLLTLRFGAELKPNALRNNYFAGYADLNILATWASASATTSPYDTGISNFSFPVEVDLGTEILLKPSNAYYPRLSVAAQLVMGPVLGSSAFGAGIMGGVRVPY